MMPMIRDRYRARFLTLGPAHSITFPARKAYVTENLLYSVAERMHKSVYVVPDLYIELNTRSWWIQRVVDVIRRSEVPPTTTQRAVERMREYLES